MIDRMAVQGIFSASETEDIRDLIQEFLEDNCDQYHWYDSIIWDGGKVEWKAFRKRYERIAVLRYICTPSPYRDFRCTHGAYITKDGKPIDKT